MFRLFSILVYLKLSFGRSATVTTTSHRSFCHRLDSSHHCALRRSSPVCRPCFIVSFCCLFILLFSRFCFCFVLSSLLSLLFRRFALSFCFASFIFRFLFLSFCFDLSVLPFSFLVFFGLPPSFFFCCFLFSPFVLLCCSF